MLLFSFFKKYEPLIPVQSLFPSFVLFTSGGFRRPKPVGYLLNHNTEQNQTKNAPTIEIKCSNHRNKEAQIKISSVIKKEKNNNLQGNE